MFRRRKKKLVRDNSLLWGEDVADTYHAAAARDMDIHWELYIEPSLGQHPIDYDKVLDFACGYGRNTDRLLPLSSHVTMVDVNEHNLEYCRKKYAANDLVDVIGCNGYDLRGVGSSSVTLLYTFDSMVHFPIQIVEAYIPEFFRVIAPGGFAFIHHSNYTDAGRDADFRLNPHWRNYMSAAIFAEIAVSAGFKVVEQKVCGWGGVPDIDCISVLRKL